MEFIFTFFCFCSEVSLLIPDFSAFIFYLVFFPTVSSDQQSTALPPLLVRLFPIQACDIPFQGPSLGRPILGASNHDYLLCLLIYVDFWLLV